jgi:HEPN domain-containing protein
LWLRRLSRIAAVVVEQIALTDAERAALAGLRAATRTHGGPMEHHSLRVFFIAERLGADSALRVDREVLMCACLLHDVGLYPAAASGDAYVRDSRRYAERVLKPFEWAPERLWACLEAVEHHHRVAAQWQRGNEVELVRRADLVDGSAGLRAYGLRRCWLRGLFAAVPRNGLYRELARQGQRLLCERPQTLADVFAP